jgi:DNA polymerase I
VVIIPVNDKQHAELIIKALNEYDYIIFDTETTGLDIFTDKLLAMTACGASSDTVYFFPAEYAEVFKELKVPVVAHNFKFDFKVMAQVGVDLTMPGLKHDTFLLDHLLDENQLKHSLDTIVQRRYNDNYKDLFWSKYENYHDAPIEEQMAYACKDTWYTDRVYTDTLLDLRKEGIPDSLIEHVRQLALALYPTELKGIRLDLSYLSEIGTVLRTTIDRLKFEMRDIVDIECQFIETELYEAELDKRKTPKGKAGVKWPTFNFDSSAQLSKLLYSRLRLPVRKNKDRNPTCDDAALESLEHLHPVVEKIREYRGNQKVYTSFIEGSIDKAVNGRVYPSFNVAGTATGRLSSSEPNLQQLPASGGVRGIYVPDEGNMIISADYGQVEVVVAAHFSQDKNLLRIINEGVSKHDITNTELELNDRKLAKTINFAMQYLCSTFKIKQLLNCDDKKAEYVWNKYWQTYDGERKIVDQCIDRVNKGLPIITPFGRHRRFPVKFQSKWEREKAYRQAYNALIQGTAADLTSRSLWQVNKILRERHMGKALFSVHDEILIEVRKENVDEAKVILNTVMVDAGNYINLTVPLKAEVSDGMERWLD